MKPFGLNEMIQVVWLGRIMVATIFASVAIQQMPQGNLRDCSETRRTKEFADGILVKYVIEEWYLRNQGEVVHGLISVGQGPVKVATLIEIADGLAECDLSNEIPSDLNFMSACRRHRFW
jgi:hypothetical protein